jgi:hypothetical protein
VLQGSDIKFIKSPKLRWYSHVERMQNQQMPSKLQPMHWEEQEIKTTYKVEGWCWRGFKYSGNKIRAGHGRRLLEMEEHCIGSQSQWIVVLEKNNKKEMHNYITLSLSKSKYKSLWVQQFTLRMSQKTMVWEYCITWILWEMCLKKVSVRIFVPMKFKELLAETMERDFCIIKLWLFVYPLFVH